MTTPTQDTQVQENDKEKNFRLFEQKMKREIEQERNARLQAEQRALELEKLSQSKSVLHDEDEDDNEPYVDKRRLKKESAKLTQQIKQDTQGEIQRAVQQALQQERQSNWIKKNSDFFDVLERHADRLAEVDPELAETILEMPQGFERQKLVYKNIKALGLDQPAKKEPTIQDKIDANRKSPYYQPSGMGTAPYSAQGDYSPSGQKNAYDHMIALKSRLRRG